MAAANDLCHDEKVDDAAGGAPAAQLADVSKEDDARIRRRVDMFILPVMMISYMFQFLDKLSLAFASIMTLNQDIGLHGTDYNWASSIYYFGYLVASYPAGALMVRLPLGKTIAASVLIWGVILILTPAVFNTAGLLANRFFLGAAEAAIGPGLGLVVSMWYKRSEQPLRHGTWFFGNMIAGMFGNLVAYGIGHITSIPAWKALFAIFGGATVLWAVGMFWLLPDLPQTAWFLSAEDRDKAVARTKTNMTGIKNDQIKWYQVKEAMLDPQMWLLCLIMLAGTIANGGVANFGPIILKGLGFNTFQALLLNSGVYLYQACVLTIVAVGSTYLRNTRTIFYALIYAVSLVGVLMVQHVPTEQRWVRFVGYTLNLTFSSSIALSLSLVSGNIAGFTKKVTVNMMTFVAYCVGNIIGPHLFFEREKPAYPSGFIAILVSYCVATSCCILLRVYLIWQNRRHNRMQQEQGRTENLTTAEDAQFLDLTDKEMINFRYVY